jgi:ABC-type phosphate transport system permease subunit
MGMNLGLDFVVGLIPIFGDIFDMGWKANKKNIELIEKNINPTSENGTLSNLIIATLTILILVVFLMILDFLT